ncbi:hypothetical protein EVAR_101413_1 [Eumeta japonica]|uniref:Uncharacterized protein n=1 Tax=Eumeta variegata TaxID=151549 RepID=A0A4C1SYH1_EUMVA|nr:hypothetical protein EVAR_101413_1 [Eumeta japonica]
MYMEYYDICKEVEYYFTHVRAAGHRTPAGAWSPWNNIEVQRLTLHFYASRPIGFLISVAGFAGGAWARINFYQKSYKIEFQILVISAPGAGDVTSARAWRVRSVSGDQRRAGCRRRRPNGLNLIKPELICPKDAFHSNVRLD